MDSPTVLVTGGSGFIAQWCIAQLLEQGFRVRATVRTPTSARDVDYVSAALEHDAGWHEAVAGCRYALHIASPFPATLPKHADELIGPARDGTLRVLRHCVDAGVQRVVMTSSAAAMAYGKSPIDPIDESCWTDVDSATPYAKSKTLAERAAWDFMARNGGATSLVSIAPTTVIGPLPERGAAQRMSYSLESISRLLDGAMPAIPNLGFSYVDVRDIADLHIRAMLAPAAAGQRFLGAGTFLWYAELAGILREQLGASARSVPRRSLPDRLVKLLALFDRSLRPILPELSVRRNYSGERARQLLDWSPRAVTESIVDCANSLLQRR